MPGPNHLELLMKALSYYLNLLNMDVKDNDAFDAAAGIIKRLYDDAESKIEEEREAAYESGYDSGFYAASPDN